VCVCSILWTHFIEWIVYCITRFQVAWNCFYQMTIIVRTAELWNLQEKAWRDKEPEDRRIDFVPQRHSSLRLVPSYPRYVNELFERCLDLYLCPRQRKMRVSNIWYFSHNCENSRWLIQLFDFHCFGELFAFSWTCTIWLTVNKWWYCLCWTCALYTLLTVLQCYVVFTLHIFGLLLLLLSVALSAFFMW